MSISSANNHNRNVYHAPRPPPPPARVESTSPKPLAQSQSQAAQEMARLLARQLDKYEQLGNRMDVKAGSQPDLTGKPQFEQWTPEAQESQDSVRELGGSRTKFGSGTDAASGGTNSAGTVKESAVELMSKTQSEGKQTYPQNSPENKGEGYGQEKKNLFDAATKAGASKEEAAIMVSQYMLEGGRDASKDGDPASKNYGPLNLNGDLLKQSGLSQEEMDKMNALDANGKPTQEALDISARAAHVAMGEMGVNGYLHHVRGGQTGYEHPDQQVKPGTSGLISDDPAAFARTVAISAQKLLETGFDNNRYAGNIPAI
jgi:hypothetical protein